MSGPRPETPPKRINDPDSNLSAPITRKKANGFFEENEKRSGSDTKYKR